MVRKSVIRNVVYKGCVLLFPKVYSTISWSVCLILFVVFDPFLPCLAVVMDMMEMKLDQQLAVIQQQQAVAGKQGDGVMA